MGTSRPASRLLLALSCLGFLSLGLPDGVLGVAWPSIRASHGLALDALGALLVSTTIGYVASSFAAGAILARMTVGTLLALSCALTAASLLGYAVAPAWAAMVALGAVAGLGAGAIDAGINAHVATHHSARTLSLLHAFYGLGTAAGPIIVTAILTAGGTWRLGYAAIGAAQLALTAAFAATHRLWPGAGPHGDAAPRGAAIGATLRLPAARLGIVIFFLYVGIEAAAGVWIFSLLHDGRGVAMGPAGAAVSVYWGGLMCGRLLFALAPRAGSAGAILRPCIAGAVAATVLLAFDLGLGASVAAVALLGLAAGPIFPALMATTPCRLAPRHTANAVGFQVAAAAVGQSLLPAATGMLAASSGIETIPYALVLATIALLICHQALEGTAPANRAPRAPSDRAAAAASRAPAACSPRTAPRAARAGADTTRSAGPP